LLWRCILVFGFQVDYMYTYVATDTRVDSLLFGCVMAIGCNPALDKESLKLSARAWAICAALALLLLLFTVIYRNQEFRQTLRYTLQGIGFFPLFFCAIRYDRWPAFRWLELPWLRGLGIISYTFYLVHERCLQSFAHLVTPSPIPKAIGGFALSVAASVLMYYLVERRFARLRRRLHRDSPVLNARVPV